MAKITGVVDKIFIKKGAGKGGKPWKRYSLSIDGEWYNNGFKAPDCAEGDEVTITYTENDFGKEVNKLVVSEGGASEDTGAKEASPKKTSENTKQIHRQNALRHATTLAVAQGHLDLDYIVNIADTICVYIETGELPERKEVEPVAPKKKPKGKTGFEDLEDDIEDIK